MDHRETRKPRLLNANPPNNRQLAWILALWSLAAARGSQAESPKFLPTDENHALRFDRRAPRRWSRP